MRGAWRIKNFLSKQSQRLRLRRAMSAVRRFPTVHHQKPHGLDAPLVVTLTSYPPRFPTLGLTLRSLLDQTVRADHTILWVTESDLAQLPDNVRALTDHGLEIRTCPDLRSYKKLIPALELYPDAWFVTADDDVYYPPDWLEQLVGQARRGTVVGARVHLAPLDPSGRLAPYGSWTMATHLTRAPSADTRLFPTGVGGVLDPPGAFTPQVTDRETFMRLCAHGDDIWFFGMARMAGTDQARSPGGFEILAWPTSQDVGLFQENHLNNRNDVQIRAMEAAFGPVP